MTIGSVSSGKYEVRFDDQDQQGVSILQPN